MRGFRTGLAALLLGAGASEAQTPLPLLPDSTVTASVADSGFLTWRTAVAEHGRYGAAFLLRGARYQVLVLTPMAVDLLGADSLVTKHTQGCQEALQLSSDVVGAAVDVRPWTAFDSATLVRPLVALTILPADPVRMDCAKGELARFASITRGLLYGVSPQYNPIYDVAYAELRSQGVLRQTVLGGRADVQKYAFGRVNSDGTKQARIYVEPETFAPDPSGADARLELHVYRPGDDTPDILPIPPELSRAVWQQLVPWRAQRLALNAPPLETPPTFELAPARDSAFRAAQQQFAEGQVGRAAASVMLRLGRRPFPARAETRNAMLTASAAFMYLGEDESSRALLADVTEVYPCLTLANSAPEAMRQELERVRPVSRCTWIPLPLIAVRAIIPGGGQWTSPTRGRFGRSLFLATAGSFVAAQGLHAYSRSAYNDYLNNRGNTQVPAKADFNRAELTRQLGNAMTIGAISVWGFAAVEAVFMEWRHKRRILEVREMGQPRSRRVGVSVIPAPGASAGIGLSVELP